MGLNLPIEEIVWEDHFSTDDWKDHKDEDIANTIFITSIGYLLKENRQRVVLVQNINNENNQVSGTITILKRTIKKRTIVREV